MGRDSNPLLFWLWALVRHKMFLLFLGGALGTWARYGVGRWIGTYGWAQGFPWGTLIINVSGSFLLGLIFAVVRERLPPEYGDWYLLLGTGFCGGYTTFSTFEVETFELVRDGSWGLAFANVCGSVVAGFVGVVLAFLLLDLLVPRR